jgi:aspartyl-tRNA(Asn)/glutamyl-tRNA(Gln) amidotransferase subunit C
MLRIPSKDGTGALSGRQAGRYTFAMRIDAALVSKVAALAALELSDAEREAMAGQLTRIVDHFEALRELPESLLEGDVATHPTPLREDVARDGSPGPLIEANAPAFQHGHFVVPRVVTRD